jgi:hypothetical protein
MGKANPIDKWKPNDSKPHNPVKDFFKETFPPEN